jgi:hypothetical protein
MVKSGFRSYQKTRPSKEMTEVNEGYKYEIIGELEHFKIKIFQKYSTVIQTVMSK